MSNKIRYMYIDILKTVAIFAIIISHVCIIGRQAAILNIPFTHFQHIGKVGVPLFLMISGALLLNRDYPSIKEFINKKTLRLIPPYIFWMLISLIVIGIINQIPLNYDALVFYINDFFNLGVNWYFWMVIGVFLAIPIINEFIKNKKIEGAKYFTSIFIISSIIYQICILFNWTTFLDLTFFITPIGYVILGYYLANREYKLSSNALIIIGLLIFLVMFIIRLYQPIPYKILYLFMINNTIHLDSFLDISLIGILESASIFILIKAIGDSKEGFGKKIKGFFEINIVNKIILSISKSSYGMYLTHIYLVMIVFHYFDLLPLSGTQMALLIAILSIITIILAWISVLIVSKIPKLKILSGYS